MYLQDEFSLVKVTSYGFNQHLIQYLASSIINSPIRTSCRADLEARRVGSNKWIVSSQRLLNPSNATTLRPPTLQSRVMYKFPPSIHQRPNAATPLQIGPLQ